MEPLTRITVDPQVMGGKPCIRGMRVTVGTIVGLIACGKTVQDVLMEYPYLQREDVLEALSYAAWRSEEKEIVMVSRCKSFWICIYRPDGQHFYPMKDLNVYTGLM